jgi:hypothetical protein
MITDHSPRLSENKRIKRIRSRARRVTRGKKRYKRIQIRQLQVKLIRARTQRVSIFLFKYLGKLVFSPPPLASPVRKLPFSSFYLWHRHLFFVLFFCCVFYSSFKILILSCCCWWSIVCLVTLRVVKSKILQNNKIKQTCRD